MVSDKLATTITTFDSDFCQGGSPSIRLPSADPRQPRRIWQEQLEVEAPVPPETQTIVPSSTRLDVLDIHQYARPRVRVGRFKHNDSVKVKDDAKKPAVQTERNKPHLCSERESKNNKSHSSSLIGKGTMQKQNTVYVRGRGICLYDEKVNKMRHEELEISNEFQTSDSDFNSKNVPDCPTARGGQSFNSSRLAVSYPTSSTTPAETVPEDITIYRRPLSTGKWSNSFAHPAPSSDVVSQRRRYHNSLQYSNRAAIVRRTGDWTHWVELSIKLFELPVNTTTLLLWETFSKEGSIAGIELFEDTKGSRQGSARVRPPPSKAFWQQSTYSMRNAENTATITVYIVLETPKRSFLIPSPIDPKMKYRETMAITVERLDFGIMYEPNTMMGMYRAHPAPHNGITLSQNMFHREIVVDFPIPSRDPRVRQSNTKVETRTSSRMQGAESLPLFESLRFCIPFAQLRTIHEITGDSKIILVISMETPPRYYRKLNEATTHNNNSNFWSSRDAWFRQTDIVENPGKLKDAPLTLKRVKPVIDIGRWITFRFVFDVSKNDHQRYAQMCKALQDYNIEVLPFPNFKLITDREPAVWEYIDKPIFKQKKNGNALDELNTDAVPPLSFPVRYQLEVCISQGCFNEHNLTREFVNSLMNLQETAAQDVLEYVANQGKRIFNPMEIFNIKIIRGATSRPKIPHYCCFTRSATVTPTTVYFNTPSVEISNRVIRQYAEYADRFLRVRFADEKSQGKINATDKETMNEVFTRISRTMRNGITIGDRHFKFLAFGNSQFRENGAYFFAPTEHLGVESIRRWMGEFSHIKVVAKHAARLGQCFSTTRAILGTKVIIKEIDDVERGGYNFTDGVGKISRFLALMVASELGIPMPSGDPPSVFQFRLGGCKGILTVCPDAKSRELHLRPSQYKFPAKHEGLEIIRCSQFAAANLNRQLILVLSALGVQDQVFIEKLRQQLSNLEQAMTDEKMALSLLQRQIDPNQMTLALAGMILEGFQKVQEPFMISVLRLWRAWSIKYLKEKARITMDNGAFLFGCVDETSTLKGHFEDIQHPGPHASKEDKLKCLPEVFVQLSKGKGNKPQVIEGPLLLARNPSLHPGDIRVVRGVDVLALHHLKDVVILPQTGDRDIPSMCSGGDLDGDDYLVIWDKDLMPLEWNHEPMDYTPPKPLEVIDQVTTNDITSFFVTFMKNYSLPSIATAHCALSDYMADGVKDKKCLRLAALHSLAVDYVKTGVAAHMTADLRPRKWPHFMEKDHKPKEQQYVSKKVLGKLYDQVERVDFVPDFAAPFDKRILFAYQLDEKTLSDAAEAKKHYDEAMRRILAQHDIDTEFEVWTTFVLHHTNEKNDYKFHEEMGEISSALKERFRKVCYDKAGGKEFERIGPFVAAMYKVTSDEITWALEECHQKKIVGGVEEPVRYMTAKTMPMISFPWLFQGILGKIARGELYATKGEIIDPTIAVQGAPKKPTPKKDRISLGVLGSEDDLETAMGVTHRGQVLELFQHAGQTKEMDKKLKHTPTTSQAEISDHIAADASAIEQFNRKTSSSGIAAQQNSIKALDIERMIKSLAGSQSTSPAATDRVVPKAGQLIDEESDMPCVVHPSAISLREVPSVGLRGEVSATSDNKYMINLAAETSRDLVKNAAPETPETPENPNLGRLIDFTTEDIDSGSASIIQPLVSNPTSTASRITEELLRTGSDPESQNIATLETLQSSSSGTTPYMPNGMDTLSEYKAEDKSAEKKLMGRFKDFSRSRQTSPTSGVLLDVCESEAEGQAKEENETSIMAGKSESQCEEVEEEEEEEVEEEVVIAFDDKPSALERLFNLTKVEDL